MNVAQNFLGVLGEKDRERRFIFSDDDERRWRDYCIGLVVKAIIKQKQTKLENPHAYR